MTVCNGCDTGVYERKIVVHKFTYGSGENAVELEATIPVYVCPKCEDGYYDYEVKSLSMQRSANTCLVSLFRDLEFRIYDY